MSGRGVFAKLGELRTRGYIYRGLVASAPLAVFYGWATGAEAALWLAGAAAWLGLGLAAANSPTRPE